MDITVEWWFNANSLPNELGLSATISDLRAGGTDITHEVNDCGMDDEISATASYQGTNGNGVNMNSSGDCLSRDGVSQVGFGDLPGWFGATCNWNDLVWLDWERVESDIRLNKADHDWTTGTSCSGSHSNDWYVEGIMTHERGPTWNVVDFPEGHPNLTMGGAAGGCPEGPDEKSTLGMGDMLSFESRY